MQIRLDGANKLPEWISACLGPTLLNHNQANRKVTIGIKHPASASYLWEALFRGTGLKCLVEDAPLHVEAELAQPK